MRILLATGFSNIERELQDILTSRGDECWRCYHRQAVVPAAEEYGAEVVVLSPALEGSSDLVETVILPLRQKGIRVIFLPGGVDMPDTREWLKRLVPYGIYCYVFDPVSPKKVVQRIERPGSLGDIPAAIRESAREVSVNISAPLGEAFEEAGFMLEREKSRKRWEDVRSVFSLFGESDAESKVINRVLNPATLVEAGLEPEGGVREMDPGKPENRVPFWRRLFWKKGTPGDSTAGTVNGGKPGDTFLETVPGEKRMGDGTFRDSDRESEMGGLHAESLSFAPGNSNRMGVLVLADRETALLLRKAGFAVVSDPRDARVCVCDVDKVAFAPRNIPLLVVRTGSVSDLAAVMARPGAILVDRGEIPRKVSAILNSTADAGGTGPDSPPSEGMEEFRASEIRNETPRTAFSGEDRGGSRPNLFVLPGRGAGNGASVPEHGVIYIACPGEPPSAGQIAAVLAKQADGSALVCATGVSTGALALGMRPEELVLSDWRVPGADAPVSFKGVTVWPVDPGKFLNTRDVLPHALVSQIRKRFSVVVVDCGGDLSFCTGAPRDSAVVVVRTGKDTADWVVERWVKDYGGNMVIVGPGQALALERVSNGYVVRVVNNPGAFEERKAK